MTRHAGGRSRLISETAPTPAPRTVPGSPGGLLP
jgi:hypothetical protein